RRPVDRILSIEERAVHERVAVAVDIHGRSLDVRAEPTIGEEGLESRGVIAVRAVEKNARSIDEELRTAGRTGIAEQVLVPATRTAQVGLAAVHRHRETHVTAAAVEVRAHDARKLVLEPVTFLRDADLAVELQTNEVLLQDEVGHAG